MATHKHCRISNKGLEVEHYNKIGGESVTTGVTVVGFDCLCGLMVKAKNEYLKKNGTQCKDVIHDIMRVFEHKKHIRVFSDINGPVKKYEMAFLIHKNLCYEEIDNTCNIYIPKGCKVTDIHVGSRCVDVVIER